MPELPDIEAGSKRRAALHLVRGEAALALLDRGGVEPLEVDRAGFAAALTRESHTLKRALTDPRLLSGVGKEDWPRTLEELEANPALGLRPAKPR